MSNYLSNIPKTIQLVKGLLYLKVLMMVAVLLLSVYALLFSEKIPWFIEKIESFFFFNLDFGNGIPHNLGLITGALFLPFVIIVLQLILVKQQRNYPILLVLVILGIILSLVRQQIPVLSLLILLLLTLKSSRIYFQNANARREQNRADILDDFKS